MTAPEPEPQDAPETGDARRVEDIIESARAWGRALVFGIGDTAKDMLEAGRKGAREAMDEGWERFDAKTKHRRK